MSQQIVINQILQTNGLDVIFSSSSQTRLWLTKLNTSDGFLFLELNQATLFLDGRYFEIGQKNAQNAEVKLYKPQFLEEYAKVNQKKFMRIGVEKEYLTIGQFSNLKALFPNATFIEVSAQKFRLIKNSSEIKIIQKACQIALRALEGLQEYIKPGVTEKELEIKLETLLRMEGASKSSFDAIVVSGKRGSLPHGEPSDKVLKENELVTIDFGALYEGYCSDITRTFHVGVVTNERLLTMEKVLSQAQREGIAIIKPGIKASEIDKACRSYLEKHGFAQYFVHSTGHGLGIDVHELPVISASPKHDVILEPGMIFTVEPGIYIPNFGGIRIEDDVLVTKTGYKVLSELK